MFKTLFSKQRLPNPHPTPKPQLSQLQLSDLTPNPLQPFSCNQCNYKCTRAIHLKGHMFTHNGQRPFICNQYSYTCTIAISLKRHMLTHSGEKPFSFNERDYKCTQASDLKTHRFTHTGKKLFFACKQFNYSSTQSSNLSSRVCRRSNMCRYTRSAREPG